MEKEQKDLVMQNIEKVTSDDKVQEVIIIGVNNDIGHFHVESTKQHYGFIHWVLNRLILELCLSEKQAQESVGDHKVVDAKAVNS